MVAEQGTRLISVQGVFTRTVLGKEQEDEQDLFVTFMPRKGRGANKRQWRTCLLLEK